LETQLTAIPVSFKKENMEFIDDPQFGHKKNRLPTFLVPVLMFAVLVFGIFISKLYVDSVVNQAHGESHE
jgi:hypothetical protein